MSRKRSLPEFAMRRPVTITMLLITLIGLGAIAAKRTAVEFMPPMDLPFLGAFIPYFGATPAQVEQEIAIPAEGQFRTLPNLNEMYTNSSSGGAFISLRFEWGTNMTDALAEVRDRMERLRLLLPEDADRVFVRHFSLETIPVMQLGLSGKDMEYETFADLVDREVIAKLLRLDGVAEVQVWGYDDKMIMIDLDQHAMVAHDISLFETIGKLVTANVDEGIGQLNDGDTRYQVRAMSVIDGLQDYAGLAMSHGLKLRDVATGSYRARDPDYYFSIDGGRELFLFITKESEANTAETCALVVAELDRILARPSMEGVERHVFFNQGDMIEGALSGLIQAAQVGGLMALIVLFVFLRRIRSTIIVALAIPGSLVAAFVMMFAMGMTLNMITMMSMIVAIGMVVDNSIVVIENIYRHEAMGKNHFDAARDGASEVAMAIVAATSTTAVVFVPVFYMEGGQMSVFTRQFALPVTVALGASLVLALTVIPLAVSRMKYHENSPMERYRRWSEEASGAVKRGGLLRVLRRITPIAWLRSGYVVVLGLSMRNRLVTVAVLAGLIFLTVKVPLAQMPFQAMPTIDQRSVNISADLDPNFNMAMAGELFDSIEAAFDVRRDELGIKNILKNYTARNGSVTLFLKQDKDMEGTEPFPYTTEEVKDIVWHLVPERVPGAEFTVSAGGGGNRGGGSAGSRVSMRLQGDDTVTLDLYAEDLMAVMASLPEITDVRKSTARADKEIQLKIDGVLAAHAGIDPMRIAQTVGFALMGTEISRLKAGIREIPVWAQFGAEDRETRSNLNNVMLRGSTGALVMLDQLVTSQKADTPQVINRRNGKNFVYVTASTAGSNLANVRGSLRTLKESFEKNLPTGYSLDMGDELQGIEDDQSNFASILFLAVLLIFIVMSALFESCLLPLSILTTVPLAFLGVIWTMYLTGTPMDTIAFIGCILMVGVVVNNGIVIVDHINNLRKAGMSRMDAILQAGYDRIRPVMMTALTTILASMPLVAPLVFERVGQPATVSLGCALIGGLTAGTFLTLFVVPLFYTFIDDFQGWIMRYVASVARLGKGRGAAA